MSEVPPVVIRQAVPDDINFIMNSWLRSYRDSPLTDRIVNPIYYQYHHETVSRILQRPLCVTLVACDPEDSTQIYGYLVGQYKDEGLILHYVYVKYALRGFKVAKLLLNTLSLSNSVPIKWVQYSHKSRMIGYLLDKINQAGWVYNPYAAFME